MSRKSKGFGVLLSFLFLISIIFIGSESAFASNKQTTKSPTYIEQIAFGEFITRLNKQAPIELAWSKPVLVQKGGLPNFIRNCKTYIAVKGLLVKEEEKKPQQLEKPKVIQPEKQQVQLQPQPQKQQVQPKQPVQAEQPTAVKKQVALTFDDGPHKKVTDLILAVLQKHHAKATFFVLGQNVASLPDVLQRVHEQGHEIGNHSWSHRNLTKLTTEELSKEMNDTNEQIYSVIGEYPSIYRPPFGAINDQVRQEISMTPVLWNVDTMDWHHKTPAKTIENVKQQAKDKSILLMHDIYEESYEALDAVITYLEQQGYEFVTVSELEQL